MRRFSSGASPDINRLLLVIFLFFKFTAPVYAADVLEGRVVGVHDGDTLTLLTSERRQVKIRLAQIDAPESSQDFGQRSKQSLSDLAYGKAVRIEVETTDKYGRTVGKVLVDGLDANLEQVKRGMAWVYRKYAHDPGYFAAEAGARNAKTGLWSQSNPMPPWEFRHVGRAGHPVSTESDGDKRFDRPAASVAPMATLSSFTCRSKRYCREMTSCAEAKFYLTQCGLSRLDGDRDGVPCEALCR